VLNLRDYQTKSIEKLRAGWLSSGNTNFHKNQLLVLATGLGKTVVFSHVTDWVYRELGGHVLILAHREELLEQAEDKLATVMGLGMFQVPTMISREQGANKAGNTPVVTASVMTWGVNRGGGDFNERMSRYPRDYFKLIIIDEAHHAVSPSYQHILDYFNEAWVLGVTATPKRGDKVSLKNLFSREAFRMDIIDGMRAGWLCPVISHRVSSTTDLRDVRTTAGDFNIKDLEVAVNNQERNNLILKAYMERCDANLQNGIIPRQAIVFATGLDHARAIQKDFDYQGIASATITGDTDKDERRQAIADFKAKKIKVLTNYGVLTEGFDYEDLDLIISARPTKSSLLLTQILGRGTRWPKERMPNKKLDFVEIIDQHSDETATAASIFGFHQKYNCEGHDFLEAILLAEEMEKQKEYFSPWSSRSFSKMKLDFEDAMPVVDPTKPRPEWFFDNRYRFIVTSGSNLILKHRDKVRDAAGGEVSTYYIMRVQESALGGYEGTISAKGQDRTDPESRLYLFSGESRIDVVERIEQTVLREWPEWDILLNINSSWRKKARGVPCTDKQFALIKKMKLDRGRTQTEISKADAADILSRAFSR
jgi:superfamily II DNA or RNA helicase